MRVYWAESGRRRVLNSDVNAHGSTGECHLKLGFFFQAEDGRRARVRSRGLGDVYKRQPVWRSKFIVASIALAFVGLAARAAYIQAVSYTHLTLTTIYSV